MNKEKRMAGEYEITHSTRIGAREIVLGELAKVQPGKKTYLVAFCKATHLGSQLVHEYETIAVGTEFLLTMKEYANQIIRQVGVLELERAKRALPQVALTEDNCIPDSDQQDFTNEVIVYRPEVLSPEYRLADHQLVLATGGNGCRPDAYGKKVYYTDLYTGKQAYGYRDNFAGIIKPEDMPMWAKQRLAAIKTQKQQNYTRSPGITQKERDNLTR